MSKWHDEKNKYLPAVRIIKNGKSVQELLHCYSISKKQPYIAGCNGKGEPTSTAQPKTLTEKNNL
ncbi:MAG: hypothetical protein L6V84_07810 [Oscillospiraceae bacterium]|nr:MAG: hypothetical protein L6V84_07810 [Oscillospiraceae bacterium]